MKFIVLSLFLFANICVIFAFQPIYPTHERGCIYINGQCYEECKEGTHAYVSSCIAPTWSQRTCNNPEPTDMGGICDLSRCDCDPPTVLDEATKKCVKLEDCPKPATV